MTAPLRGSLFSRQLLTQGAALGGALVSSFKEHLKDQIKDVRGRARQTKAEGAEGVDRAQGGSVTGASACDTADGFDGQVRARGAGPAFSETLTISERRAPPRPQSDEVGSLGVLLAERAARLARRRDTRGRAASAVRGALQHFKLHDGQGHAYELAGELAKNARFVEIDVPRHQLKQLSAGCVVVWGRSVATRFGHVAVALGDGLEASDHVRRQTTDGHYCNDFGRSRSRFVRNYRVFMLAEPPPTKSDDVDLEGIGARIV
jgi:hypothetical protein